MLFRSLKQVAHLRSGIRDQPDQHSKTLSLLKIQNSAGCGGARLQSQLLAGLRHENHLYRGGRGCSEPRSCHRIPAWATRVKLSLKKKKRKEKRNLDDGLICTANYRGTRISMQQTCMFFTHIPELKVK